MNNEQNVVLMTLDSLRADHISCLGYANQITPNIDNLAKKGVLFSQAFSNGAGSVTSFLGIMTSTYPLMHPQNGCAYGKFWIKLSSKWPGIAQVLKSRGFSTAAFKNKKIDLSSIFGYARGFDVFDDPIDSFMRNNVITKIRRKLRTIRGKKAIRANVINRKALSWLKKHSNRFFLWLHYMDVHAPPNPKNLSILNRIDALGLMRKVNHNASRLSEGELSRLVSLYDEEIKYVDNHIGSLMEKLRKMGICSDNTFFVVAADHGEQFMEHGEYGHGRLYDEVIHVPLLIIGPGIKENTVIRDQVSLLDLSPTIVELLNIPKVESFLGTSLLSSINGKSKKTKNDCVISEELTPDFSCRTEDWKYIRHDKTNTHELYYLRKDPKEKVNLAGRCPEKVKEFDAIISEHNLMEEKRKQLISTEYDDFSEEEMEILKKYPKKDATFISKTLGIPRS